MTVLRKIVSIVWQLSLISAVFLIGDKAVQLLHLPLPGSVAGMALLFLLLSFGVLKVSQLEQTANFLLKHMAFFFVPITVGLMNYGEIFHSYGFVLLALLSASLAIAFVMFRLTALKIKGGG